MPLKIKRLIASIMGTIIYLIVAIGAFMDNYIILGVIAIGLAIGAFFKKSIFLDFILIILVIGFCSSLTLFSEHFNYNADGVVISTTAKIVIVFICFSLLASYTYFLKSNKKS